MALLANEARFFRSRVFLGHVLSKTKSVTPHFFYLFGKSRSLPFYVASLKKSVRGNFWARTSLNAIEADKKNRRPNHNRKKPKKGCFNISETIAKKSSKIVSTEIRCTTSDWTTPDNGVKKPEWDCSDGRTVRVHTKCMVECNFGYQLKGISTAVCTPQGNWNPGSPPKCIGKYFRVIMVRQNSWWLLIYMDLSYGSSLWVTRLLWHVGYWK